MYTYMDLNLLDAKLVYKYAFDRAYNPPNQLLSKEELCIAMEKG